MKYTIVFRQTARKNLERMAEPYRGRIKVALRVLEENPAPIGSIRLQTAERHYYRIRVGSYRIVYEVTHEIRIVTIVRVGHRKEVYRGLC